MAGTSTINLEPLVSQGKPKKKQLSTEDFKAFIEINKDILLGETFDGTWGAEVVFPSEGICVITSDVRVRTTYRIDQLKLDANAVSRKALLLNKKIAAECVKKIKSRGKNS